MLIASAGTLICGFEEFPEFPALATQIIPRLNAISAPFEIKEVIPLISL